MVICVAQNVENIKESKMDGLLLDTFDIVFKIVQKKWQQKQQHQQP